MNLKLIVAEDEALIRTDLVETLKELNFEISAAVSAAISAGTPLILTDIRGRTIVVPADRIGFVEIGEQAERRVGFGSL